MNSETRALRRKYILIWCSGNLLAGCTAAIVYIAGPGTIATKIAVIVLLAVSSLLGGFAAANALVRSQEISQTSCPESRLCI
jgi:hypothetical protein